MIDERKTEGEKRFEGEKMREKINEGKRERTL